MPAMRRRPLLLALLHLLPSLLLASSPLRADADGPAPDRPPPWAEDVAALLAGVAEIAAPGALPGSVVAFGERAFPVILGGAGGVKRVPIAAAARWGHGRALVVAHDAFTAPRTLAIADSGAFLENALRWTAGTRATKAVRVGTLGTDLGAVLTPRGFEVRRLDGAGWVGRLEDVDVVVLAGVGPSPDERAALVKFVTGGGGLVASMCPWGWMQVTRAADLGQSGLQTLVLEAGLAFTEETVEITGSKGYVVMGAPGAAFHAESAIDLLVATAGKKATGADLLQASLVAQQAIVVLPPDEKRIRGRVKAFLRDRAEHLVPTEREPLRADRPLDRFLLAAQVGGFVRAGGKPVPAHPAAATFPGAPPRDAKVVRTAVDVDLSVPGWHSTGLYAAPGQTLTATTPTVSAPADGKGAPPRLALRIGCHKDTLWHLDAWPRVPEITVERPFDGDGATLSCAFGGPVYVVVPEGAAGRTTVTILGAVEAPLYVLGTTTKEAWAKSRRAPGPWAELASSKVILSVPSDRVRDLADPEPLMRFWDRVLDADADLAGIPHERPRPERYVADVEISAGYMHSGYPIMMHLDAAARMVDVDLLRSKGDWGLFHEMGHNHQQPEWTFDGTTEVTCNLFSLYVLQHVCGMKDVAGHGALAERARKAADHVRAGAKFAAWKADPFLALAMYVHLIEGFGWEPFRTVFAQYRALPAKERPANDDAKRDQWMTRFSRAVGRDLGPFFQAWGVPTSDAARASIAGLPAWMPPGFPPR